MSINFSGSLGQGEVFSQAGSKKPSSGQVDAIFEKFSAFMTPIVNKNSPSVPSSDVLNVRLSNSEGGALDKSSAQEVLFQLIGNDFVQVDDHLEKLISEKGFEGFLEHIDDVGELDSSIHFNPTAAFIDTRISILKPDDIINKKPETLTISTIAELEVAIKLFKKSMQDMVLAENTPKVGSLEAENLDFINDLIRSAPIELGLNDNDTSAVFFDIRDLKTDLSGAVFSNLAKPDSGKLAEAIFIPQIVTVKLENVNIDEKIYEPFVAVKVELNDLENNSEHTDIIELPDAFDGTSGARLFGVNKSVEIDPEIDAKSKLLISLSIPKNVDLEKLPDFVKLNISLGNESRLISNQNLFSESETSYIDGTPTSKFFGPSVSGPVSIDIAAGHVGAVSARTVLTTSIAVDSVSGGSAGLDPVSGVTVGASLGTNLTADLDVLASEFLMKLKEMSGVSNEVTNIVTKTTSTKGLAINFKMPQISLPEKNTFILNHKNAETSFFDPKQKPIDLVQNIIVFDNEIKLVSSMRNDMRSDFISSVVALESHLKSFYKFKSDKFNFFGKEFETNALEQKSSYVEQKAVSNIFNPKSILEAYEAVRMKSISSQNYMAKDDLLKTSQANITTLSPFKNGNQFANPANASTNPAGFASSINSKIMLYDAQYASRISMLVVDKVLKGQENFEIHLEPKSFGKIKINVLMDKQVLDIRMVAETQAAASLLRGSEDTLNQITNQNGMKLAGFSVGMQSGSDQQRQNSNQTRNRAAGKSNSMLEHTKTQNLQTATSGSTSTGLNLIA